MDAKRFRVAARNPLLLAFWNFQFTPFLVPDLYCVTQWPCSILAHTLPFILPAAARVLP